MLRVLVLVVLASGVAIAEPEVTLQITPAAPHIVATVRGLKSTLPEHVTLSVGKTRIPASAITSYAGGSEPMTLALVINGQEIWIGNDQHVPPSDSTHYPGALTTIASTLDRVAIAKLLPENSLGTVVVYADTATTLVPLGPISGLTGRALGTQKDYAMKIGSALVSGIELAVRTLRDAKTTRRVLLVIGDGNDTNNEVAVGQLRELAEVAARERIETHAIVHRGPLSEPQNVIAQMIPGAVEVASDDALGPVIETVLRRLDDRFYAQFDARRLRWDGVPHAMVLRVGNVEMETQLALPKGYQMPADTRWRWRLLGAAIAVLALIALAFGWRMRRTMTGVSRSEPDGTA
jgi:hypothetical protein